MHTCDYDILIVGGGPAGFACAYQLRNENFKIALIDQSEFPRDKICGDALGVDVINQLHRMDSNLGEAFMQFPQKKASNGVRFFSPEGNALDIGFKVSDKRAAGYICARMDFDKFLIDRLKDQKNLSLILGEKVQKIERNADGIVAQTANQNLNTRMIIGADGAHSVVGRYLTEHIIDKEHYCAGLRQYYSGVEGFHPDNFIELHFYKELLPGYFWIFPLPDGKANVGLGMLSSTVSRRKTDLKKELKNIIENHPNIRERFRNAKALEEVKGFGLPIGSRKRSISGDNFLLLGDAASLIDPFTGEGIANAIRSGRIAAEHLKKCISENRFDSTFNRSYDEIIYKKMWNELRIGRSLQKLSAYPALFNFIIRKANKNQSVRTLLTSMLDDIDLKKELSRPGFYLKLLFT